MVSSNLTNKILNYTWNFGDTDPENYELQRDKIGSQNPSYTYTSAGSYIVTLTVVDSDQVTSTKTAEVLIEGIAASEEIAEEEIKTDSDGEGSLIGSILKGIFYIILVSVLLIMMIVSGLLIFLKIQHPDLVFEELIDELKIKILGMMGVHEELGSNAKSDASHATPPNTGADQPSVSQTDAQPEEARADEGTPEEESSEEPELAKQDAPVPDWLKAAKPAELKTDESNVIEGEVEEDSPAVVTTEEVVAEEPIVVEPKADEAPPTNEGPNTPSPKTPVSETPAEPVAPETTPSEEKPLSDDNQVSGGGEDLNKSDGPVPDWLKNA